MSTEQPRRPIEPLVSAVNDSVATGYQALELVFEGLRESLRLQAGAGTPGGPGAVTSQPAPAARPARTAGPAPPPTPQLLNTVNAIASELLLRAGALAEEVAHALAAQAGPAAKSPCVAELNLSASAGGDGQTEFTFWNTGPVALRSVTLRATELLGAGGRLPAELVSFSPDAIAALGPGEAETVEVTVSIPAATQPAVYRGLIEADPGGASAVLVVTATSAAPQQPREKPEQ